MWEVIRKRYPGLEKQIRGVRSVVALVTEISWHKTKGAHVSLWAAPPARCQVTEGITNVLWLQVAITVTREGNHLLDVSSGKFYLTKQEFIALKPGPYPRLHTGAVWAGREVRAGAQARAEQDRGGLGSWWRCTQFLNPWISPGVEFHRASPASVGSHTLALGVWEQTDPS